MALKPDRSIESTEITLVCNDVIVKGAVLVYGTGTTTSASGAGVYTPGAAEFAASSSGRIPAGLSLANFVNIDQTRQKRNFHKDEQIVGEKVPLVRRGWVITDQIAAVTIAAGDTAYLGASGLLTNSSAGSAPKVGQFATKKDADGYAKVHVHLPQV